MTRARLLVLIGAAFGLGVVAVFGISRSLAERRAEKRATECMSEIKFTQGWLAQGRGGSARVSWKAARACCSPALQGEVDRLDRLVSEAEELEQKRAGEHAARVRAALDAREAAEQKRRDSMTVEDKVAELLPLMHDTHEELSPGTVQLALWSSQRMTWKGLQAVEATSYGKMMKDPGEERGKRICLSGTIVQIQRDGSAFDGILNDGEGQIVRFLAVASTGELVAHSFARFCGVATGTHAYSNNAGGTSQGVQAVGMFDLAANRK